MYQEDTISAVATAVGEGGIGIIRLSGPQALKVADALFRGVRGRRASDVASHTVAYGRIVDPATETVVDEVLLLVMRAPRSYTREDVVEIHCHGGPAPLRKILDLTLAHGARLAEPGEFTKRAFLNGRLDLAQAEAVIDIIRAKTDASLRMAVNHLAGGLSAQIRTLRDDILAMIAHLEAAIDFPEEDIEELAAEQAAAGINGLLAAIDKLLATAQTGRILREGLETVIIGKPNVGKSSLLNALLREKRAIVTDIPGTTRDIIEEYVNIRGVPLKIVDTAGIRETTDLVEKIGVERAQEIMRRADLVLLVLDASAPLSAEDRQVLDMLQQQQVIVLINKTDLPVRLELDEVTARMAGRRVLRISVLEGTGLDELEQAIVDMVYAGKAAPSDSAFVSNVRHAAALRQARQHLADALATTSAGMPPDFVVIDLRAAWEKLGEITGETVGDDIIDQIFARFCIGK
ncbi:tRNA uridine-5-carboxymethylaminomethyl(34) synthesis GTPase MnmE [Sporolituus thermophilus]|uniref:tRNA modification GTPase MnmE n=1 Tax=Sporolituus thermophilus DSM 23256 TaxID=1123285 RepID=A0A1G7LXT7_9FIRM|nr:tRNA uridine-5-carboxymethylaminomethyl(34) synthesis GTPase MnmE [Sporolituus thermophilus]SDF54216.1 tRNA modification GTPase [Sporolituus thermophilus DSM 23256]